MYFDMGYLEDFGWLTGSEQNRCQNVFNRGALRLCGGA